MACRCRLGRSCRLSRCVHDRIAIEIMRGCPWQCRFCQSTVIKRPLRIRAVETIVPAALESYRNTGYDEISLLSLSTSDYPYFEQLVKRMHETFRAAGGEHFAAEPARERAAAERGGADATAAPQRPDPGPRGGPRRHARADSQEDQERRSVRRLPARRFATACSRSSSISCADCPASGRSTSTASWKWRRRFRQIGKRGAGPPGQGDGQRVELRAQSRTRRTNGTACRRASISAGPTNYLRERLPASAACGQVPRHRHQPAGRRAQPRRPADERGGGTGLSRAGPDGKLDEHVQARAVVAGAWPTRGIDVEATLHRPVPIGDRLPWDHINVKKGRAYLEKEQNRAVVQLAAMADAV